ncbi:hypothetical protein HYDPIDRAFT_41015 [Hydnomerulius pinastri MD-312]|uniref:C2 NT-type domain-containing protein n=1 Tax=Hydnomerulius pinastri MD-312 TaxID=994086 RepID=A0A0C9VDK7_9AGAM|nr:hypothetical protein HYDPIDRAFT_41015 [Hydnomerulius pinastri MD-312]
MLQHEQRGPNDPIASTSTSSESSTSLSPLAASGATSTRTQTLIAPLDPASSSLRHRSSTLKPPKKTPARLNLAPHPNAHVHLQTPNPSLSSVISGMGIERPPSPRPPSPAPPARPHSPIPRVKSPTLLSPRPGTPSFPSSHVTARPSSPTPVHPSHPHPQPSPAPITPSQPTGIRAHFAHLLPRHAVFLVRLTVHQLHNVPLVHGEFGVRWKVKGVTSPSTGGGILGKVKGRSKGRGRGGANGCGTPVRADSEMGKEAENGNERGKDTMGTRESDRDTDNTSLLDGASASVSDAYSIANSSSTHSHSYEYAHSANGSLNGHHQNGNGGGSSQGHGGRTHPLSIPSVVISANSPITPPSAAAPQTARSVSGAPSLASVSSTSSTSSYSVPSPSYAAHVCSVNGHGPSTNGHPTSCSYCVHPNFTPPAHYLSADWLPQGPTQSPTLTQFDIQVPSPHPHPHSHPHNHSHSHQPHPHPHTPNHPHHHHHHHPHTPNHTNSTTPTLSLSQTAPVSGYSPAKGHTPFVKLKDHNVPWEQTLDFVVQMGIGRENGELGECGAKLVVMQKVIPGDPDAPRNPRVGAVYLNLAQYVDAGIVTRRYLLRQSKTNATLKLTIHIEHTAGETSYTAPPLPKGEILSGVASLLESSDVYRTRPRTLDLYRDALSHSSSEGEDLGVGTSGGGEGSDASSLSSMVDIDAHGHHGGHRHNRGRKGKKRRPFDPAKLPAINDPRGTERLIEALFNPVPVTQLGRVNPFTYLVETQDGEGDQGSLEVEGGEDAKGFEGEGRDRPVREEKEGEEEDADYSLYADTFDDSLAHPDGGIDGGSDYHSTHSYGGSVGSKKSLRSTGSKMGLRVGEGGAGLVNVRIFV